MYLSHRNFICRLSEVDSQVTGITLGGGREAELVLAIFELKAKQSFAGEFGGTES